MAFALPEWEARQPIRPLWVTPELLRWMRTTPQLHDLRLGAGRKTMAELLEMLFCDFRCAQRFSAGDLRRMLPSRKGIWKMHPYRLRIYGWAPGTNQFAAVTWAFEKDTKTNKRLNDQKRDDVLEFVRVNRLRETVTYGDVNAVFPRDP